MNAHPIKTVASPRYVRARARTATWRWPLLVVACGLAATLAIAWGMHPSTEKVVDWKSVGAIWSAGVGLSLLAGLAVALLFGRTAERAVVALDERLHARNRLETAVALEKSIDPLALAQREETDRFLAEAIPARASRPWGLYALFAAVAALVFLHGLTLVAWKRPWEAGNRSEEVKKKEDPAAAIPTASIRWESPEVQATATQIEAVPLDAVATSSSGLRQLELNVEVNGTPRSPVAVAAEKLGAPGDAEIKTFIYLDELEVEPFDVVSYHLSARRIDARELAPTVSPIQFIQIKPFRDDVMEMPGGPGLASFPFIKALKVAQLRLVKENFVLTHAEISHETPEWGEENTRVRDDQILLHSKSGEVTDMLVKEGAPAEIVNLIVQARESMEQAGKDLGDRANARALGSQGKALGLITEVEKFFIKIAAKDGSMRGKAPSVKDPFDRQKALELKQRWETQAGELELLAAEQARLADDIARGEPNSEPVLVDGKPDKNRIDGTGSERQTQLSQRIGALSNGNVFPKEVEQHLEGARSQARDSLRQLDASDLAAARITSAGAASELRLALQAMNAEGEMTARKQLAEALDAMQKAAADARRAPKSATDAEAEAKAKEAAASVEQAKRDLAKAAQQQQQTGSSKAAQALNKLAKELDDKQTKEPLDKLSANPRDQSAATKAAERLEALADKAARGAQPADLDDAEIKALIDNLERARANLERLSQNRAIPGSARQERGTGAPKDPKTEQGEGKQSEGNKPPGSTTENGKDQGKGQQGKQGEEGKQGSGKGEQGEQGSGEAKQGEGSSPGGGESPSATGSGKTPSPSGMGSGTSPSPGEGQSPGQGQGQGTGTGSGTGGDSGEGGEIERTKFARELVESIRRSTYEAEVVLPTSTEVGEIRESLGRIRAGDQSFAHVITGFQALDPALARLIQLLHDSIGDVSRSHEIGMPDLDQAPPKYRDAVAEYFESLSREDKEAKGKAPTPAAP